MKITGKSVLGFIERFIIGYVLTLLFVFVTQYTFYSYIDGFTEPELVQPFTVLNEGKTVKKGGVLELEITFKKLDPIFVDSRRQILCESGDVIALDQNTTQLPLSDEFLTVQVGIPIPEATRIETPQECVYQVRGQGQINPYRIYLVELVSEPFTLVEE